MRTPCIIITRDRLSYTKACLASLERFSDQLAIHIVDHGSTYEPIIDWLQGWPIRHQVWWLGDRGPRDLWDWSGLPDIVGDRPYLVTDPDVVLDDACPGDWLERMRHEMGHDPDIKVGLGLRIDDLPENGIADKVRAWESEFWNERTACGAAWKAPVDTTLALYPPLSVQPNFILAPAKRLDAPYLVRHLPWYGDLDPAETQYYREHALPGTSHWINGGW